MKYNTNSHSKNAMLSIFSGIGGMAINALFTFLFRTVFLMVLSREYLGIQGVFSNVLQILSLTELGIGQVIIFRMIKPFEERDSSKIAAYMGFYKRAYHITAVAIIVMGLALLPFLNKLVNPAEIPNNVNLYLIFGLFLLDNACSYLFTYKRTLLDVNQKTYVNSVLSTICAVSINISKAIVVLLTKKFELTILAGIVTSVIMNGIICQKITRENEEVFKSDSHLDTEEKKTLIHDAFAVLTHRIGFTVLNGTDNLIMSTIISLESVALYSNYYLIINTLKNVVCNLFGSYQPTIANYIISQPPLKVSKLFDNLTFANQWISSCTTICLFVLINPFITIWLDDSFLFKKGIVVVFCAQYFIGCTRSVSTAFIQGSGLFVRDKARPFIEATINLVISIYLAKKIGVAGVFIGTCISELLTCYWREIYLLHEIGIVKNVWREIVTRTGWIVITIALSWVGNHIWKLTDVTILSWIVVAFAAFILINCIYFLLLRKTEGYEFLKTKLLKIIRRNFIK